MRKDLKQGLLCQTSQTQCNNTELVNWFLLVYDGHVLKTAAHDQLGPANDHLRPERNHLPQLPA